jgi:hypothetical protein
MSDFPSILTPLPQSAMSREPASERNSRHGVFPPYLKFSGCGVGVEPRTPQNLICISKSFVVQQRREPLIAIPDSKNYAKRKVRKNQEKEYKESIRTSNLEYNPSNWL